MDSRALTIVLYITLLLIVPFFINIASKNNNKSQRYIYYSIILIIPSFIAAFKGITGTDSQMYEAVYNNLPVQRSGEIEAGYMWLNNTFNKFMPYEFFLLIIYFIILYLLVISIDKYRTYINVYIASFILFSNFYFLAFNIMRQCLAVSICVYGIISYINDRKLIKMLLIVLIAFTIHVTSIVCVLVLLLSYLYKSKSRFRSLFLIITLIIGLFLLFNRGIMSTFITNMTNSTYYSDYLTKADGNNIGILKFLLQLSPIIIILCAYYKYFTQAKENIYFLLVLMIVGYVITAIGSIADTQADRGGLYFTILNTIVLSFCANNNLKLGNIVIKKDITTGVIFVYFLAMFIYSSIIRNYGEIIPYMPFYNL